jgi:DNA uptake protein ComE-like DNA-binding protein
MIRRFLLTLALPVVIASLVTACPTKAQVGKNLGLINPNHATEAQLTTVPHITPAIAKGLVERRPFMTMTEVNTFLTSQGITAAMLPMVYAKLWDPINLNTATKAEILLIPGVGDRMLHEFEEYRPYVALAQFHREIDKYVDDAELARLEQYVFAPMNINTASDADLLTIPGLGDKMLHEFKEYRPYTSIAQFRREIGKYVNAKEVARLERYIKLD